MSRAIRRLHRKQTEFTNFSSGESTKLSEQDKKCEDNTRLIEADADAVDNRSNTGTNSNEIDSIRAELPEDDYHSKLTEYDFSDDTHDWGGESEELLDDYWHFVGLYE